MDDPLPIVYIFETAQQFWSELDDTLHVPKNASLSTLDSILKRFVHLCATYHEQYLQSPMQLDHAIGLLLDSELFTFHSERMSEILSDEARTTTDPHRQLITYTALLLHGRRHVAFFRSYKRWQPIFPMLMDHVLVDIELDPEADADAAIDDGTWHGLAVPIEAKLRDLSVRLLYEACRTSKLAASELRIFDAAFIERLFDLVEITRSAEDESFNYSVIKLIVALNEQFMISAPPKQGAADENRVMRVLTSRLASSPTFGGNMIFMLNRAGRSPEDFVMQLLVLKLLFALFTTKATCEYFYTNDLCVLVDVFLRELSDLDEESDSLRHTYLRVLHPLLTKTQLRNVPYKRPQIVRMLESLVAHPDIREINPTTKRLVERCLAGDWRVGVPRSANANAASTSLSAGAQLSGSYLDVGGSGEAGADVSRTASPGITAQVSPPRPTMTRQRSIKGSRSAENMRASTSASTSKAPTHHRLETLRKSHANDSSTSLPAHHGSHGSHHHYHRERERERERDAVLRANSLGAVVEDSGTKSPPAQYATYPPTSTSPPASSSPPTTTYTTSPLMQPSSPSPAILEPASPASVSSIYTSASSRRSSVSSTATAMSTGTGTGKPRRSAPPPPVKRRKPPAVPGAHSHSLNANGSVRIETIRSSSSAPVVGRAA